MIWIELLGLPASGKSTCASMLVASLRRRGFNALGREEGIRRCLRSRDGIVMRVAKHLVPPVRRRLNDTDYAMPELCRFASRHPDLVAGVLAAMACRPLNAVHRREGLVPTFRSFAEYELASASLGPCDIIVHDEGIAHRCYTLFGYLDEPLPAGEISGYVQKTPFIHCAVWTDVSPGTSDARIVQRALGAPRPWFSSLSPDARVACLSRGRHCLGAIFESLALKGIPLLRVNNERPPADVGTAIDEWVSSIEGRLRQDVRP